MKLFNEYTPEELLELTTEQIDDLAKLEIIKDGHQLPYEKPTVETLETIDTPHLTVYKVNLNKNFVKKEDAQRLIDSINGAVTLRSTWANGDYIEHVNSDTPEDDIYVPDITIKKIYKTEDVSHIKGILERNKSIEKKIDDWKGVMDKYYDARGKITSAIWEAERANGEKKEREVYMAECLRLADNDKIIAQRFFEKRFPNETQSED